MAWAALDAELAAAPGVVSAYVGRLGAAPAYTRLPDRRHYAASTMKVAVLVALHRAAEAGAVDLDAPVPVRNSFASARPGAAPYGCVRRHDNDDAVWQRLGGAAPLRWLARRMIVASSNLATNIVLSHVGLPAVAAAWAAAGARHSVTTRGIEDLAAREAGLTNEVTPADLAALLGAIAAGAAPPAGASPATSAAPPTGASPATGAPGAGSRIAGPAASREMLETLLGQQRREDLAAGLPAGVRVAHKNGWVRGVRHGAGVVLPDDAPPYAVVVCTSWEPGSGRDDDACRLVARVSAAAWAARHTLGDPPR